MKPVTARSSPATMPAHPLIAVAAAVACLSGCAADRETHNLIATLGPAAATGSADTLATWIQKDLDTNTGVAETDRAKMRARAKVLQAHARALADSIDLYDPAGRTHQSITLSNLRIRAEGLDEEYRTTMREWQIWQVRHGLRKPEDVTEVFDLGRAELWK